MDTDKLNKSLTLIANLAVVASIVFLAFELRQNNELLESEILAKQAANNTKEQFANSPDLQNELVNAIINALDAHNEMSSQALGSQEIQKGLKDILRGPAKLY